MFLSAATLFLLVLASSTSGVIVNRGWVTATIARIRLRSELLTETRSGVLVTRTAALGLCMQFTWCRLTCRESRGRYSFWEVIVDSEVHEGVQGLDYILCYTKYPYDSMITNAGVSVAAASPVSFDFPFKIPSNIIDGIYTFSMTDCYSSRKKKAWVVIDLGSAYNISRVYIAAQPNLNYIAFFKLIEIRAGNILATGNFGSYTLLGYFTGTPLNERYVYDVSVDPPISARYISVQKMNNQVFQICHMGVGCL